MKPTQGPLLALLVSLATGAGTSTVRADGPVPHLSECDIDLELVAVVYAANDPGRSFALVGARRGRLVGIGSWVQDRQILAMGPRRLVLGPSDDPCMTRLTDRSSQRTVRRRRSRRR